jgi:hypothetical protein
MLLITIFVELRVVAGRSRTRACSPQAVSRRSCCAVVLKRTACSEHGMDAAWAWHGMVSVNQTRPHCVNQVGKTHSKPLAARHGRGTAWAQHAMCESSFNKRLQSYPERSCKAFRMTQQYDSHRVQASSSSQPKGRPRLKCDGTRAETRFGLSAKRTSPFKSAGASVQSTTGSRGVRISGSNAGYTMFRGSVRVMATHSIRHFPLHFPSRALPCAIKFQLDPTTRLDPDGTCPFLWHQADTHHLMPLPPVMVFGAVGYTRRLITANPHISFCVLFCLLL